jgi:hypothetical protein
VSQPFCDFANFIAGQAAVAADSGDKRFQIASHMGDELHVAAIGWRAVTRDAHLLIATAVPSDTYDYRAVGVLA